MNICPFIGCSCHLVKFGAFLNRKPVIRQFYAVNSPKTTPKKIFPLIPQHYYKIFFLST